jgi:hypothetical protein
VTTVKQAASSLKVSARTIYNKINFQLKKELKAHVKTADNKTFIDDEGINIIKESLLKNVKYNELDSEPMNEFTVNSNEAEFITNDEDNLNLADIRGFPQHTSNLARSEINEGIHSEFNANKILTDELSYLKNQLEESIKREQRLIEIIHDHDLSSQKQILNLQVLLKSEQDKVTGLIAVPKKEGLFEKIKSIFHKKES